MPKLMNADEAIEEYAQRIVSDMDIEAMEQYIIETLFTDLAAHSDKVIIDQITEMYPDIHLDIRNMPSTDGDYEEGDGFDKYITGV